MRPVDDVRPDRLTKGMRYLLFMMLCAAGCDAPESEFDPMPAPEPAPTAEPEPEAPMLHGVDSFDPACRDAAWTPGECVEGRGERQESRGAGHIADDEPITYDLSPPAADNHRGMWARWGEYRSLPPQRWLHNLEHGGIAFLYHPCADAAVVDELRAIAQAQGDDFRWILTPYADLPTAVAVVAWEWRYQAECVQAEEIEQFIEQRYRQAPEDVAGDGRYEEEWIGR
jgi:hypothetical protein